MAAFHVSRSAPNLLQTKRRNQHADYREPSYNLARNQPHIIDAPQNKPARMVLRHIFGALHMPRDIFSIQCETPLFWF